MQKQCTLCNTILDAKAEFCNICGTRVENQRTNNEMNSVVDNYPIQKQSQKLYNNPLQHVPSQQPVPSDTFCPECGEANDEGAAFCHDCGYAFNANVSIPRSKARKKNRNFKFKPIYAIVAAVIVIVVLVAIFLLPLFFGGQGSEEFIIYARDGELQLTTFSDMESFEMTSRLFADRQNVYRHDFMWLSNLILLCDNERFIFYPDREDMGGFTFFWRDLNADNTSRDAANRIDAEISSAVSITSDGSKFFYIRADRSLFVFDRVTGERNRLASDVGSFFVSDSGDYIVYTTIIDGESDIFEMVLDGTIGERSRIATDASLISSDLNERVVFFVSDDSLFYKAYDEDRERISSDVNRVVSLVNNQSVFYITAETVETNLASMIFDDMLQEDMNLVFPSEPVLPPQPIYPAEVDYSERVWVASFWGTEEHPETGEWGLWEYQLDWDAFDAAISRYWDDMSAWEEVITPIWEAYNEALNLYHGRAFRDDLRAALSNVYNAVTYDRFDLHYWSNGVSTQIAYDVASSFGWPNIMASSNEVSAVVYQKFDEGAGGRRNLSDVVLNRHIWSVHEVIYELQFSVQELRSPAEDIFVALGSIEFSMDVEYASGFVISPNGYIYFFEYDERGYGSLMSAQISDGTLGVPVSVDDEVDIFRLGNQNNNIYYFKEVRGDVGDLYVSGRRIAIDVHIDSLYNFPESDSLLFLIDYNERSGYGVLVMHRNGENITIANDVAFFAPFGEDRVAFLTDYNRNRQRGDLMLYYGGERPTRLDTDVTAILWNSKMVWDWRGARSNPPERQQLQIGMANDNPTPAPTPVPAPELAPLADPPSRELPPKGTFPFNLGLGAPIWGDPVNQIGWSGEQRTPRLAPEHEEDAIPRGLDHALLLEASWFVLYVDNTPDDEVDEFLELMIFGSANWDWDPNVMQVPIVGVYSDGVIAIPIAGHPYMDHITDDDLESRNFGIMFQYAGGIANLGITGVYIYAELP